MVEENRLVLVDEEISAPLFLLWVFLLLPFEERIVDVKTLPRHNEVISLENVIRIDLSVQQHSPILFEGLGPYSDISS